MKTARNITGLHEKEFNLIYRVQGWRDEVYDRLRRNLFNDIAEGLTDGRAYEVSAHFAERDGEAGIPFSGETIVTLTATIVLSQFAKAQVGELVYPHEVPNEKITNVVYADPWKPETVSEEGPQYYTDASGYVFVREPLGWRRAR